MPLKITIIRFIDSFNRLRKQFMGFPDALGVLAALAGFLIFIYHIAEKASFTCECLIKSIEKCPCIQA